MRIGSINNGFVFSLPTDFIPEHVQRDYKKLLEKNWVQYENVIDYLNSTIKSVNMPGISFDLNSQNIIRGKQIRYKPAKNSQDILTSNELPVVFKSVDQDLNYWIMFDIFYKHYLDTENQYLKPLILYAIDIHRDVIYQIKFSNVILKSLTENSYDYSQQKLNAKEFTITFSFDFIDIEFMLEKKKLISTDGPIPTIIQKI